MKTIAVLASALSLALAGCSVDQTQEAKAPEVDVKGDAGKLPNYDIVKKEEGRAPSLDVDTTGGQLPKFDVDMAKVSVQPTTASITVPDVDVKTEKKQITVPDVDVQMPNKNQ